jgi:uncharacterized protein YkwD
MKSFTQLATEIFNEINQLRTDPQGFSKRMQEIKQFFRANNAIHRPKAVPVITHEGIKVLNEAIEELENLQPLDPLHWSEGLARAAQLHANDTGTKGIIGHVGSDDSNVIERGSKFGKYTETIAEAVEYGSVSAFEVVSSLLMDDGLYHRPHRKALINPNFKKVGVGAGLHSIYKTMAVVVFAEGFEDFDELENVAEPQGYITDVPEADEWVEGAVHLNIETTIEVQGDRKIKKVKRTWEMADGHHQQTEDVSEID